MQRITLQRLYQVSGITAAIVLALLLVGTTTGRETLAWIYLTARDAIANATHVHGFPRDRFDPTCPQCM
jgi:hypothetical protein